MKTLVVIPARYGSARFMGKALKDETGWPIIRHVYEQVKQSTADRIIVATDDQRIMEAVEQFAGEAMMTKDTHKSGTDRVAEVVNKVPGYDVIVNVQGDEPEIEPASIDKLIRLQKQYQPFMSTLCCKFPVDKVEGHGSPLDPACNKVILGTAVAPNSSARYAIYFSRSPIPYPSSTLGIMKYPENYYLHVGMYAYSPESINQFTALPQGFLEATEGLEQLRAIEAGHTILVDIIPRSFPGIDTPDDYQAFIERWNKRDKK